MVIQRRIWCEYKKTKFIHLHPSWICSVNRSKSGKEIKNNNLYGELVVTGFLNNAQLDING